MGRTGDRADPLSLALVVATSKFQGCMQEGSSAPAFSLRQTLAADEHNNRNSLLLGHMILSHIRDGLALFGQWLRATLVALSLADVDNVYSAVCESQLACKIYLF